MPSKGSDSAVPVSSKTRWTRAGPRRRVSRWPLFWDFSASCISRRTAEQSANWSLLMSTTNWSAPVARASAYAVAS